MKLEYGCTRAVWVIGSFAIKLPTHCGWKYFLKGLLANMEEAYLWRQFQYAEMCPVLWACPGGWFLIMKRARILTDAEFLAVPNWDFLKRDGYSIEVELKSDSFGWLDERLVAVDYAKPQ